MRKAIVEALGLPPGGERDDRAVEAYRYLLSRAWSRMLMLLGPLGAQAILERGIRVASREQPLARLVVTGEAGPDLSGLMAESSQRSDTICPAVEALSVAIFETMTELTGNVIAGPILEEASRRSRSGGD